jgi:uncharacterized protein (DUF1697 family)
MGVFVAMLRAVNVGGRNMVKMEELRGLCSSLGCSEVQTYVQSGNVVFCSGLKEQTLQKRLEDSIEKAFGFRTLVVLRSSAELKAVIARNPFPAYARSAPAKLHVNFLYADPGEERRKLVRAMRFDPEEMRLEGREIYIYYPVGAGLSKLRWAPIDKTLGTAGTARNWNTVVKLREMAEGLG